MVGRASPPYYFFFDISVSTIVYFCKSYCTRLSSEAMRRWLADFLKWAIVVILAEFPVTWSNEKLIKVSLILLKTVLILAVAQSIRYKDPLERPAVNKFSFYMYITLNSVTYYIREAYCWELPIRSLLDDSTVSILHLDSLQAPCFSSNVP